jgi:hypothetical protein
MAALARELKAQGKVSLSAALAEPDLTHQILLKKQLKSNR